MSVSIEKKTMNQTSTAIPTGSRAARMASLTAEMLKVGIFKMEEGGDPHWLARYFFASCERAWEKYKTEHSPHWTVTATEIVEVAISLMRVSFLEQNGFEHCNLPKIPLPQLAVQWIAGSHHVLCVEQTMKMESQTRNGLAELNKYWSRDQEAQKKIPVSILLRLAGCDELKPTNDELISLGLNARTFKLLSATQKHCRRLDVLRKYEVLLDIHPYSGKKPERTGPPVAMKIGTSSDGTYPLSLFTAEHILALRKAKEQRIKEVRGLARKKRGK
jgi:hypothetical protein